MTVLDCKWVADQNHVFTPSKPLSVSWSIMKNCLKYWDLRAIYEIQDFV